MARPTVTVAISGWLVGNRSIILLIFLDTDFHESDTAFFMSPVWEALCFYFKPGCTRSSSQIVLLPPPSFSCRLPYRRKVGKVLTGERRVTHSQGFRSPPHQVPRFLRSFCCFQPFSLSLSKHVLSTCVSLAPEQLWASLQLRHAEVYRPTHTWMFCSALSNTPICDFRNDWNGK